VTDLKHDDLKHDRSKDFVQDDFYENGHPWLKLREIVVTFLFWIVLLAPILVLFNSLSADVLWPWMYHWDWPDGIELARFLVHAILLGFIVVLLASIALLLRNNHYERKVYPNRITYDRPSMERRKAIMEHFYAERFGSPEFRESARYYSVRPEQNIDEGTIDKLFKDGNCEIH